MFMGAGVYVAAAVALAAVVALFYAGGRVVLSLFGIPANPRVHCMTCGSEGRAQTRTRGSLALEIVLWCLVIVPGLIYSVWRVSSRRRVCATCGAENIVPLDTPAARGHRAQLARQ